MPRTNHRPKSMKACRAGGTICEPLSSRVVESTPIPRPSSSSAAFPIPPSGSTKRPPLRRDAPDNGTADPSRRHGPDMQRPCRQMPDRLPSPAATVPSSSRRSGARSSGPSGGMRSASLGIARRAMAILRDLSSRPARGRRVRSHGKPSAQSAYGRLALAPDLSDIRRPAVSPV